MHDHITFFDHILIFINLDPIQLEKISTHQNKFNK